MLVDILDGEKLCSNCTHYFDAERTCTRPNLSVNDRPASVERRSNHYRSCGSTARHFEQKAGIWGWIVGLLKNLWP